MIAFRGAQFVAHAGEKLALKAPQSLNLRIASREIAHVALHKSVLDGLITCPLNDCFLVFKLRARQAQQQKRVFRRQYCDRLQGACLA